MSGHTDSCPVLFQELIFDLLCIRRRDSYLVLFRDLISDLFIQIVALSCFEN